jgi:hypothetical protein
MRLLLPLHACSIVCLSLLSSALVLILASLSDHTGIIRAQDAGASSAPPAQAASGAKEGELCLACHTALNPALTQEWRISAHGQKGVNCFDCHRAEPGDVDAFNHKAL